MTASAEFGRGVLQMTLSRGALNTLHPGAAWSEIGDVLGGMARVFRIGARRHFGVYGGHRLSFRVGDSGWLLGKDDLGVAWPVPEQPTRRGLRQERRP